MAVLRPIQSIGLVFVIATFAIGSCDILTQLPPTIEINNSSDDVSRKTEEFDYLPCYIVPEHYDIKLVIEEDAKTCRGELSVIISIGRSTNVIQMHMHSTVNIKQIKLYEENESDDYKEGVFSYNPESQIVSINIDRRIPIGKYKLYINFESVINNNTESILKISFTNGKETKWLIATNFYSLGARQLFPCWDKPRFAATFNLYIGHNKQYIALSHGKGKRESEKYKTFLTEFATTPRMSTHLLAFALISYPTFYYIPGTILMQNNKYLQLHTQFAQATISRITTHMQYEWGNLKNFPEIHHVAIPDFRITEMSHWRLIFYRETDIIYDLNLHPPTRVIDILRLVARQVAYQWFGVPSSSTWSHQWLNEGLALLFGIEAIDKIFPDLDFQVNLFVVQNQHESLRLNSFLQNYPSKQASFNISNNGFYNPCYSKITFILRMLQHVMTEDLFRKGVENYIKADPPLKTPDNFWQTLQDILNASTSTQLNIKNLVDGWIKQTHYPEVKITKKSHQLWIEIMPQHFYDPNNNGFIPLTITGQSNPNFDITSYSNIYWVKNDEYQSIYDHRNSLFFYEDGWIIANLQQAGYYRVNYDNHSWQKIIYFLNYGDYKQIHVLNRAKLIDDAYHFMVHRTLHPSIFWELTNYLYRDTDYVAWYPMFKAMEDISQIIPFSDIKSKSIKMKLKSVLRKSLKIIQYEESPDDGILLKLLRQESARWACVLNDDVCLITASNYLRSHLSDKKPLLPWWKEWAYCNGLQRDIWNMLTEKKDFNATEFKPQCLKDSDLIIDYLITLSHREKIQGDFRNYQDFVNFLAFINPDYVQEEKFSIFLEHSLLIFQDTIPTNYYKISLLIKFINEIYDEGKLRKIQQFVEWNKDFKGMLPEIRDKLKLRREQIKHQSEKHRDTFDSDL